MKFKKFENGKYLDKDGYVLIPMPKNEEDLYKSLYNFKGMGYEHRVVMAKKLQRILEPHERVHHISKIRTENTPENLELKDVIEHLLEHKAQGDLKLFSKDYQPRWKNKNSIVRESLHIPKKEDKQFAMGMKAELEHKDITKGDPILTGKIVKAHLKEMPNYYTKLKKMEKNATINIFKKTAANISKSTATILGSSFGSIPGIIDFWKARHYQGKTRQNLQLNGLKKGLVGAGLGILAGNIGRVALNGEETAWKNLSNNIKPNYTKQVALGTFIGSIPGAIEFARAKDSDKRQKALKRGSIGASIGASIGGVNSLINRL